VSPAQNMLALERANEIRLARSEVKHKIAEGRMTVAEALGEECCQSMTVGALLCCQHRWGRARMLRFLSRLMVPIGEARRVDALTERQRRALVGTCPRIVPDWRPAEVESDE
jgi:hypothetical protein